MSTFTFQRAAATAAMLGAASSALAASPILATATSGTTVSYPNLNGEIAVRLDDAGDQQLNFTTTKANEKIVLQFNIDCSVGGGGGFASVALLPQVDGGNVAPSVASNACPSLADGTPVDGSWSGTYVLVVPKAGAHATALLAVSHSPSTIIYKSAAVITH